MRKGFALITAILMIISLAACSSDVSIPTRSDNTKKTSAAGAEENSTKTDPAATQAASQPPETAARPPETPTTEAPTTEEPETEPPHIPPHTAESAPALTLAELPNPQGEGTRETNPESGAVTILIEDLGEDGHTRTMNCFDEEGNLLWYESYEYDEAEQVIASYRKDAEEITLSRETFLYENGALCERNYYESFDTGEGFFIEEIVFTESYYPNGTLSELKNYFRGSEDVKEVYAFSEDGAETYHAVYDIQGKLLEEYIDGKKVILLPDTALEIFQMLNETPEDEFEETWEACQEHIEEKNLTEDWEKLCHTLSGLLDEYNGSSLYWLREEYGLKLFTNGRYKFAYRNNTYCQDTLEPLVEAGEISPLLFAKVYRMGCYLDFGGTIWLPMEFSIAMSDGSVGGISLSDDGTERLLDWSNNDLRAFAMNSWNIDPLPDYQAAKEAIPDDGMDYAEFCNQLTETISQKIGIDTDAIEEAYLAHLQDIADEVDAAAAREEGKPFRVLVVDSSETFRGDEITRELLASEEESMSADVVDRDQQIYEDVFGPIDSNYRTDKFMLTSYPRLADVILELNVTHPFAGHYQYSDGTPADVWNTVITLTAYRVGTDDSASVVFSHTAGQTVSVTGGTKIYMRIPNLEDEEYKADAQAFIDAIIAWFPDLAQ